MIKTTECYTCGAKQEVEQDRKSLLLKMAMELLMRQNESCCVLNLLEETVHYDGAECDGHCLLQDIAIELDIQDGAIQCR